MRQAITRQQTPEERERARFHGEVLTPEWMVDDMLTALDACDTSLGTNPVSNPDVPLLDMCGGTGNFALCVVRRRARTAGKPADAIRNVRIIELDDGNVDIARQRCMQALGDAYGRLSEADEAEARRILDGNFVRGDALGLAGIMLPDECRVIVSNPPYQDNIAHSDTPAGRAMLEMSMRSMYPRQSDAKRDTRLSMSASDIIDASCPRYSIVAGMMRRHPVPVMKPYLLSTSCLYSACLRVVLMPQSASSRSMHASYILSVSNSVPSKSISPIMLLSSWQAAFASSVTITCLHGMDVDKQRNDSWYKKSL